jgi:putative tricarboxylic transport membrane protein
MNRRPNLDTIAGGVVIILSAATALGAARFPAASGAVAGPAMFPLLVAAGWAPCGVALLISGWRVRHPGAAAPAGAGEPPVRRMLALLGLTVGYALLLPLLGFISASALFLTLAIRFLGYRHGWRAGALALAVAFVVFWLFATVMKVPLPAGWIG